jgi:leader peptidase (prepilin peptidase)/N-methyltransferase
MAAVVFGALGLMVGSFVNVVVCRVPDGRSVVRPPSACPKCGARIRPYDNVPVVSWLALRGRCRDCRSSISVRYPAVELFVAAVCAGVGWRFGATWTGAGEAVLLVGLISLGLIDLDHMVLPRRLVYATLSLVGVVFLAGSIALGSWARLGTAAACGAVLCALFFGVNHAAPHALGFGDVRLVLVVGSGLGWLGVGDVVVGIVAASALGSLVGVGLVAAGKATRRTAVPFGTFLAAGAVVAVLGGSVATRWWEGLF